MDLRSLEVFLAVAETLNFSRAAEQLYLSPSAVTETIKRLERALDVTLLERTSRRVVLTPAGQSYAADAAAILGRVHSAAHRARCSATGAHGIVRLGVTLHPASHAATRLVARADREHPQITVECSAHFSLDQVGLLRNGAIDLGVAIEPAPEEGIERFVLTPLDWVVVVPETHPFVAADRVPLAALSDQTVAFVGPAVHRPAHDLIVGGLRAASVSPKCIVPTVDDQSLIYAVGELGCIGISVWNWAKTAPPHLTWRRLAEPAISPIDLELIWVADSDNPAVSQLTSLAARMVADGSFTDLRPA